MFLVCDDHFKPTPPSPARTMMVFMVQGLFSSLQFPYAQFPCAELTGELFYDLFWEAVKRIENVGLKVHVCTTSCMYIPSGILTAHTE